MITCFDTDLKDMKIEYAVGIDPGVETGVALKNLKTGEIEELQSMMIHAAFDYVDSFRDNALIVVEDARLWNGRKKGITLEEMKSKEQGAGSVKRDCIAWEDFLKDDDFFFKMVPPKAKGRKKSHAEFKMITGWNQGTTNQHKRDAAMLIYGYDSRIVRELYKIHIR